MNKIMRFVQPIRLGHVTSHTSTNLHHHQHSSPPPPLASLGIPSLPHLCPLTTTFTTCQNTATTAETRPPRRHTSSRRTNDTNRPQLVENAPDATETEQRARGKGGEHAKDKGRGRTRYACHFYFFKLHLLISVSPKQVPLRRTSKTRPFRHVLVFGGLSHLLYVSF